MGSNARKMAVAIFLGFLGNFQIYGVIGGMGGGILGWIGGYMETLLDTGEVAGVLKVADKTVRKWVLKRQIPFLKIGKVVRFRPSQIDKWVEAGGMAASGADDLENEAAVEGELFV